MKILNLCGQDFAGVGIRLTDALNSCTEHEARHICWARHPFGYKTDIVTKDQAEISKWIDWADFVNCYVNLGYLGGAHPENVSVTYLGSDYVDNYERRHEQAEKYGAKEIAAGLGLHKISTKVVPGGIDLLLVPVPVDEWAEIRAQAKKELTKGKPIVCQTPSQPKRKRTSEIRELLSGRDDIELRIITGKSWGECMRLKAEADIALESFTGTHGTSGLEAAAMGIPVITHSEPEYTKWIVKQIGYVPYYDSPLERLPEAIDALLGDKSLYQKYSDLMTRYVRTFHDYPAVANRFVEMCQDVLS